MVILFIFVLGLRGSIEFGVDVDQGLVQVDLIRVVFVGFVDDCA